MTALRCKYGHRWKTLKKPGRRARCQRCFHEHGRTVLVLVLVPEQPGGPR